MLFNQHLVCVQVTVYKIIFPYIAAISDVIDICVIKSDILWNQTLEYMWLWTCWNAVLTDRMWMSLFLWHRGFCRSSCVLWSCLVPSSMRFSASEMCVSWGGASVGGCSACLPVPHSSAASSHSHRHREEESMHSSPAHSDPVVHSPRRSESLHSVFVFA